MRHRILVEPLADDATTGLHGPPQRGWLAACVGEHDQIPLLDPVIPCLRVGIDCFHAELALGCGLARLSNPFVRDVDPGYAPALGREIHGLAPLSHPDIQCKAWLSSFDNLHEELAGLRIEVSPFAIRGVPLLALSVQTTPYPLPRGRLPRSLLPRPHDRVPAIEFHRNAGYALGRWPNGCAGKKSPPSGYEYTP